MSDTQDHASLEPRPVRRLRKEMEYYQHLARQAKDLIDRQAYLLVAESLASAYRLCQAAQEDERKEEGDAGAE